MTDENLSGVAPAEDATPLPDAPETVGEVEEQEQSESSTDEGESEQTKKIGGVTKRINELVAQREEEKRRAQRLESMLEQVLANRPQPEKAPEPVLAKPQGEPKLEDFATYEEFVDARADWRAEQRIQQWEQRQRDAEAERQKATQAQTFQAKVQEYRSQTPDFDAVALNPSLPVTDAMAEIINGSENGPELLYQLGKNPAEAARIAALPPLMAAVELGKFAVKASLPQPKKLSSAPPPVEPLTGGAGTLNVDPDKMSADDWMKWRQSTLKR
jgi:hypothetical protein